MVKYILEINTPKRIPDEVLREHVSYHLRQLVGDDGRGGFDVKLLPRYASGPGGTVNVQLSEEDAELLRKMSKPLSGVSIARTSRNHPFDGPEVFDDYVPVGEVPADGFPKLAELMRDKRAELPRDEGDWDLDSGDRVGED